MTKNELEILPCPNPECGEPPIVSDQGTELGRTFQVWCSCGYTGPWAPGGAEAIRLHNAIAEGIREARRLATECRRLRTGYDQANWARKEKVEQAERERDEAIRAVRRAHADLAASVGIAEVDCECKFCLLDSKP